MTERIATKFHRWSERKRSASDILFEQIAACTDDYARRLILKPQAGIAKHTSTPAHMRKPWKQQPGIFHIFRTYRQAKDVANLTERITGDPCFVEQTSDTVYVVYRREPGGRVVRA